MPPLYAKIDCYLDSNPKIRKAGRAGREVFMFLLRRNRLLDAHGFLPAINVDPDYLADQLMMDCHEASRGVTACCDTKLITVSDQNVTIIGWSDEWAREPKSDAERQADRRRKLKEAELLSKEVTFDVTNSHDANVTSHGSHVREEKKREEKRENVRDEPALALARCAVEEINRLTGKAYDPESKSTVALAKALAKAKRTEAEVVAVIRDKHAEWGDDPKMRERVCPATLLAATNFAKYLDELNARGGEPRKAAPISAPLSKRAGFGEQPIDWAALGNRGSEMR